MEHIVWLSPLLFLPEKTLLYGTPF